MLEHLFCSDSFPRIQRQHLHQQIHTHRPGRPKKPQKVIPITNCDNIFLVDGNIVRQLRHPRPIFLRRRPQRLPNQIDLIHIGLTGHKRRPQDQLGKHRSHTPHIDRATVVTCAVEQLGRPIPARDDLMRHGHGGIGKAPGEPEIGQLDLAVRRDQQVVGLDVAVQHEVGVAEPDGPTQHAHPGLDVREAVRDVRRVLDELLEVAEGKVFEHEVEVLVLGAEDGV